MKQVQTKYYILILRIFNLKINSKIAHILKRPGSKNYPGL